MGNGYRHLQERMNTVVIENEAKLDRPIDQGMTFSQSAFYNGGFFEPSELDKIFGVVHARLHAGRGSVPDLDAGLMELTERVLGIGHPCWKLISHKNSEKEVVFVRGHDRPSYVYVASYVPR
jgi:hypothetical protein